MRNAWHFRKRNLAARLNQWWSFFLTLEKTKVRPPRNWLLSTPGCDCFIDGGMPVKTLKIDSRQRGKDRVRKEVP
jgi:hypothetical protein